MAGSGQLLPKLGARLCHLFRRFRERSPLHRCLPAAIHQHPAGDVDGWRVVRRVRSAAANDTFGKISYVNGRDQTLSAPLPAISPLDSTVGLRFHDAEKGQRWGCDVGTRIVATQNEPGAIRLMGQAEVVEEATGGFTTCYIRGYWNCKKNLRLIAGIDNVFNRSYQEQLDLRLTGPANFTTINGNPAQPTRVLATGISPYFGVNWVY